MIAGYERKNAVISAKEKLIVSYHEIGHALVAARSKHSMPVAKITIVPRTSGALGYTMPVSYTHLSANCRIWNKNGVCGKWGI